MRELALGGFTWIVLTEMKCDRKITTLPISLQTVLVNENIFFCSLVRTKLLSAYYQKDNRTKKKKKRERTKGAYNQKQVTNVKRCPTRKIFPKRSNNATENKGLEAKAQKVSIYNEGEGDVFKIYSLFNLQICNLFNLNMKYS